MSGPQLTFKTSELVRTVHVDTERVVTFSDVDQLDALDIAGHENDPRLSNFWYLLAHALRYISDYEHERITVQEAITRGYFRTEEVPT